jgi:hypothetical protein
VGSHGLRGLRLARADAVAVLLLLFVSAAAPAGAQVLIKVGDTVALKFGVLLQPQADWAELPNASLTDTAGYQQNLFLRRARFIIGGRLARDIFFFFQTDSPNLGKGKSASTALGSGFQIYDALGEWRIAEPLILQVGLMKVPYSRESLKGTGTQFIIDTSAYYALQQAATQSTGGSRDTGALLRGYFLGKHLEYRVGIFQGARQSGSHNPFRSGGRLQYEFFDVEDQYAPTYMGSFSYPGSYLGDKKVLAVGAGYDFQGSYRYYSGDVYASIPTGTSGAIEGTIEYQYLDGGTTFTTLPVQNTFQLDLGYYIRALKLAPNARYEQRVLNGQEAMNGRRFLIGLNYYPFKHNLNVKAAYTRIDPKTGPSLNEFQVQLQFYYW